MNDCDSTGEMGSEGFVRLRQGYGGISSCQPTPSRRSSRWNSTRAKADGGGRGIRTPGTLPGTVVFKTTAIDHSAIPPAFARGSTASELRRDKPAFASVHHRACFGVARQSAVSATAAASKISPESARFGIRMLVAEPPFRAESRELRIGHNRRSRQCHCRCHRCRPGRQPRSLCHCIARRLPPKLGRRTCT